jgi:hypothetical protein
VHALFTQITHIGTLAVMPENAEFLSLNGGGPPHSLAGRCQTRRMRAPQAWRRCRSRSSSARALSNQVPAPGLALSGRGRELSTLVCADERNALMVSTVQGLVHLIKRSHTEAVKVQSRNSAVRIRIAHDVSAADQVSDLGTIVNLLDYCAANPDNDDMAAQLAFLVEVSSRAAAQAGGPRRGVRLT